MPRVPRSLATSHCRNCNLRLRPSDLIRPWNACSEDCADALRFERELGRDHPPGPFKTASVREHRVDPKRTRATLIAGCVSR
jgi:hypothetical protein